MYNKKLRSNRIKNFLVQIFCCKKIFRRNVQIFNIIIKLYPENSCCNNDKNNNQQSFLRQLDFLKLLCLNSPSDRTKITKSQTPIKPNDVKIPICLKTSIFENNNPQNAHAVVSIDAVKLFLNSLSFPVKNSAVNNQGLSR